MRWSTRAYICRYGNQNIFEIMGRDPKTEPLTLVEMVLFAACIQEHVTAERKPFEDLGLPPPT